MVTFLTILPVLYLRVLETYTLSGNMLCKLRLLTSEVLAIVSSETIFRQWLMLREKGRGTILVSISRVYQIYHVAHIQRLFLRRVLLQVPYAVITGSFPAAMYMEHLDLHTWWPNDVDIFVFNVNSAKMIIQFLLNMIIEARGLRMRKTSWKAKHSPLFNPSGDLLPVLPRSSTDSSSSGDSSSSDVTVVDRLPCYAPRFHYQWQLLNGLNVIEIIST